MERSISPVINTKVMPIAMMPNKDICLPIFNRFLTPKKDCVVIDRNRIMIIRTKKTPVSLMNNHLKIFLFLIKLKFLDILFSIFTLILNSLVYKNFWYWWTTFMSYLRINKIFINTIKLKYHVLFYNSSSYLSWVKTVSLD